MKASVIIIFYNEENYLKRCINSILKQTFCDFELILVNDGSNDNSEKIIKEFKDQRIRYFKLRNNHGYATARNKGLEQAKGKHVFFTDADCVASPDWIEKGIRAMEKNRSLVAAFGLVNNHKVSSNPKFMWDRGVYRRGMVSRLYPHPSTVNSVYKREVLERIGGFDERYNCGSEDADVGLKILLQGPVKYIKDMKVFHMAKKLDLGKGFKITKRRVANVYLVKDHSKNFPKLRRSNVCYGFIVAPHYFLAIFFPPLVYTILKNQRGRGVSNPKDLMFLVLMYFSLIYTRLDFWRAAFKERIFLI